LDIKSIIKLIRPNQYIKNLFIFLPLFFALKITDYHLFLNAFVTFIGFSLTASSIYILNDYFDIEDDKKHPKKRLRPLASGVISKKEGIFLMLSFFIIGVLIVASQNIQALYILLLYVIINIAYTLYFKHVAIVDVIIISVGFVLRLYIGAAVTNTHLSMWIILMTFLLALFMALAKRRDDILIYIDTGKKMRKVLDGYNLQFLDTAMSIMASVVIVAYIIYCSSEEVIQRIGSQYLYITALFVIVGVLRYLQIAFVLEDSGSPTKIVLKDRFIQFTILGWILTFVWILY